MFCCWVPLKSADICCLYMTAADSCWLLLTATNEPSWNCDLPVTKRLIEKANTGWCCISVILSEKARTLKHYFCILKKDKNIILPRNKKNPENSNNFLRENFDLPCFCRWIFGNWERFRKVWIHWRENWKASEVI